MELALTRGVKNSKRNAKIKKEGKGPLQQNKGLFLYGFFFPPFLSHIKL
jgi:hypothetical protein